MPKFRIIIVNTHYVLSSNTIFLVNFIATYNTQPTLVPCPSAAILSRAIVGEQIVLEGNCLMLC